MTTYLHGKPAYYLEVSIKIPPPTFIPPSNYTDYTYTHVLTTVSIDPMVWGSQNGHGYVCGLFGIWVEKRVWIDSLMGSWKGPALCADVRSPCNSTVFNWIENVIFLVSRHCACMPSKLDKLGIKHPHKDLGKSSCDLAESVRSWEHWLCDLARKRNAFLLFSIVLRIIQLLITLELLVWFRWGFQQNVPLQMNISIK